MRFLRVRPLLAGDGQPYRDGPCMYLVCALRMLCMLHGAAHDLYRMGE